MYTPEILYNQFKEKTRVVICGSSESKDLSHLFLKISDYHDKGFNYFLDENTSLLSEESDFVIFYGANPILTPNIVLITGFESQESTQNSSYDDFISNITPGGILIYNLEDLQLKELVENHTNPIRKIPYQASQYETTNEGIVLNTEDGAMPTSISNTKVANQLTGLQYLCQAVGMGTEDFLEALTDS